MCEDEMSSPRPQYSALYVLMKPHLYAPSLPFGAAHKLLFILINTILTRSLHSANSSSHRCLNRSKVMMKRIIPFKWIYMYMTCMCSVFSTVEVLLCIYIVMIRCYMTRVMRMRLKKWRICMWRIWMSPMANHLRI